MLGYLHSEIKKYCDVLAALVCHCHHTFRSPSIQLVYLLYDITWRKRPYFFTRLGDDHIEVCTTSLVSFSRRRNSFGSGQHSCKANGKFVRSCLPIINVDEW